MPADVLNLISGSFAQPAREKPLVTAVEAAYRQVGIDARHVACEVAPGDLGDAVRGTRAMGWRGFTCSWPHEVAVIEHLDRLTEPAAFVGAVDCVVRTPEGELVGEITAGKGFVTALRLVLNPVEHRVVVLGAGPHARACAVELALAGVAQITVAAPDPSDVLALTGLLVDRTGVEVATLAWEPDLAIPEGTDIVLDATSAGLRPDDDPGPGVDLDSLDEGTIVADLVPEPAPTRLLRDAAELGCQPIDGVGALAGRAALAVRLWTGVAPDLERLRTELFRLLAAPAPSPARSRIA